MKSKNKNSIISIDMELGVDLNNLIYMYEGSIPNVKSEKNGHIDRVKKDEENGLI